MIGAPLLVIMRRKRWLRFHQFILAGASIGLVTYGVLFLPNAFMGLEYGAAHASTVLRNSLGFALIAGISGCVASSVFWILSERREVPLAHGTGD